MGGTGVCDQGGCARSGSGSVRAAGAGARRRLGRPGTAPVRPATRGAAAASGPRRGCAGARRSRSKADRPPVPTASHAARTAARASRRCVARHGFAVGARCRHRRLARDQQVELVRRVDVAEAEPERVPGELAPELAEVLVDPLARREEGAGEAAPGLLREARGLREPRRDAGRVGDHEDHVLRGGTPRIAENASFQRR